MLNTTGAQDLMVVTSMSDKQHSDWQSSRVREIKKLLRFKRHIQITRQYSLMYALGHQQATNHHINCLLCHYSFESAIGSGEFPLIELNLSPIDSIVHGSCMATHQPSENAKELGQCRMPAFQPTFIWVKGRLHRL